MDNDDCPPRSSLFGPGWFTFARYDGNATHYSDQFSPAHVDVLTSGIILAFVIVAFCFYIIVPAFNSARRWSLFTQITVSLIIGGIIVVGNFGHEWEVGHVKMKAPYKPGSEKEVSGDLTLHIALRGINITLKGDSKSESFLNEKIDYNEHFSWEWVQGRFGFGIYAGRFSRDFRAAVLRGLPLPILQVAEYFTFDGEGIRFGRHYRLAGWYSHIMLWSAFPMWIITNVLFCVTARSGALFLKLTGIFQLISCGIWYFLRNPIELSIPFESTEVDSNGYPKEEIILSTKFGPDFYLVFINGILCVVLGLVILVLDNFIPDEISIYFGIDPLSQLEMYLPSAEERQREEEHHAKMKARRGLDAIEKGSLSASGQFETKDDRQGENTRSFQENAVVLKRRPTVASKLGRLQKSFRNKPVATPRSKLNVGTEMKTAQFSKPSSSVTFAQENEIAEENENDVREPLLQKDEKNTMKLKYSNQNDQDDDGPDYDNLPPKHLRRYD